MKLMCPKCGSRFEMEQAVRELEQSEVHDIAAKLGQHWRLVYEYSDCFRQSEHGDVSLTKRLRIFRSVARLLEQSIFTFRGKKYRSSPFEIVRAMTEICNAQKWGFRNHNYLLAILAQGGEKLSAEGLSAKEERKREESRRTGESANWRTGEPGKLNFKKIATNYTNVHEV